MSEVPREYLGLARAFHAKVHESEQQFIAMRNRVWAPLQRRMDRKPICPSWRRPECIDLFALWSGCPAFGRIHNYTCWEYTKRRIEYADARLVTTLRRFPDGGTEPAVSVAIVRLIGDMRFERSENGGINTLLAQPINNIVVVGLHALARYFQKAFHPSEAALIVSLWDTFTLARQALQPGAFRFAIPVGSGGHWHGNLVTRWGGDNDDIAPGRMDDPYTSLDIKTFHTDREDPRLWISPPPPDQEAA